MAGRVKKKPRPSLFNNYWVDENGVRHKMTRQDYAVAYRLWAVHKDIRQGTVKA